METGLPRFFERDPRPSETSSKGWKHRSQVLTSAMERLPKLPLRDGNLVKGKDAFRWVDLPKLPLRDGNLPGTSPSRSEVNLPKLPLRDGNRP